MARILIKANIMKILIRILIPALFAVFVADYLCGFRFNQWQWWAIDIPVLIILMLIIIYIQEHENTNTM
jgi:hypothetical protein